MFIFTATYTMMSLVFSPLFSELINYYSFFFSDSFKISDYNFLFKNVNGNYESTFSFINYTADIFTCNKSFNFYFSVLPDF